MAVVTGPVFAAGLAQGAGLAGGADVTGAAFAAAVLLSLACFCLSLRRPQPLQALRLIQLRLLHSWHVHCSGVGCGPEGAVLAGEAINSLAFCSSAATVFC